jgi:5-oxoprolinase (ATP-hydrolysing)
MVKDDIPLNQGCLAPITFRIPDGCLLRPCATAAVVGGNVLTSQRVTDVVLRAFGAAAASQGCMNNTTFGDEGLGYYETVAGGAGAGPGWHGRSGVHTHMTNTRITDPEILERRYPVVLRKFCLRPGSGGGGAFHGGDGIIREIEARCCICLAVLLRPADRCFCPAQFLRPLTVGILSERRALPPFGLAGGEDASRGVNLWLQRGGLEAAPPRAVSLGGKATVLMQAFDRLRLLTPGGGGYGDAAGDAPPQTQHVSAPQRVAAGSLAAYSEAQLTV